MGVSGRYPGGDGGTGSPSTGAATALISAPLGVPSSGKVGRIRDREGSLYICRERNHAGSTKVVTWTHFPPLSDISALWNEPADTYRYRGEAGRGADIDAPRHGDVFNLVNGAFEVYSTSVATGWYYIGHPDGWIGRWPGQDEADEAATGLNEVSVWGNEMQLVNAYVAGQASHTSYVWEPFTRPTVAGGGHNLFISSTTAWDAAAHAMILTLPAGSVVESEDIISIRSPDDIAGVEDAAVQIGAGGVALPLFDGEGMTHTGDDFLPGHLYELVKLDDRWVVVSGAFHSLTEFRIHDATQTVWSQAVQRFTWTVANPVLEGDLIAFICPAGTTGTIHPVARVNAEAHLDVENVEGTALASRDFIPGQDYLMRRDAARYVVVSGELATTVGIDRGGTGAQTREAARASLEIGEGVVRSTAISHDTANDRLRITVGDTSQIRTGAAVMLGPLPAGLTGSDALGSRFIDAGATSVTDRALVLRDGTTVSADDLVEGHTHLLLVEPTRLVFVGEVGPRSLTSQEGVAYSGTGWVDWVLYQRAAVKPVTVPLWTGADWNPLLGDWQTSQQGADLGADLTQTLWIGHGSARIASNGVYTYHPQTVTAQFDQQFSVNGLDLWHAAEVAADQWTRFRLPDGSHSAAIPTTTRASSWVALFPQQYPVSGNVLETINRAITGFDVTDFDFIQFLVRPFENFSSQDNQNHSHTFIIARPSDGWPVNDQSNRFILIYRATYGLVVAIKEDGPDSSLPVAVLGWNNANQTIRYSFELRDTARLASQRDGQVNALRFHDQGAAYNRHYLLARGFAA